MRQIVMTMALATVLLVAACAADDPPASSPTTSPDCGDCVEELARVREKIAALPRVRELRTLKKYAASPTNGATVKVELYSRATGDGGLADQVAGIVWRSELAPVDVTMVTIEDADGELVPTLPYDFRHDSPQHAGYVERWGERPVG